MAFYKATDMSLSEMAALMMEHALYPRNGCVRAHLSKAGGQSGICPMGTCGGFLSRNMAARLWAVVLKETGEFIGDCGLTIQNIDGESLPEIGYHIHKKYWRKGFGSEAAKAVRDWAFENTKYDCLYSYMKYTNIGSYSTAVANGMKKVKEYPDEKNEISYAYAITRKEWEALYHGSK